MNEWKVSGQVVYLRKLDGEFAASVKLRGRSRRRNSFSEQILEVPCLMERDVYEDAKKKGFELYGDFTLAGHIESWPKGRGEMKIMYVCDGVEALEMVQE